MLSTQLLQSCSAELPPSVVGGVPGRSARDLTYELQHGIEMAKLSGESLSGFRLDMIKIFQHFTEAAGGGSP